MTPEVRVLQELGDRVRLCLTLENVDPEMALLELEDRCELAWLASAGISAPEER